MAYLRNAGRVKVKKTPAYKGVSKHLLTLLRKPPTVRDDDSPQPPPTYTEAI
jgi:hypothetical protein